MSRSRAVRLTFGFLVLGAALFASVAPAAASFETYVGCSTTALAQPSNVCQLGEEPGAFFESTEADVEYEVCVTFPNAETLCAEEQPALQGTLYVNPITTNLAGEHLVSWSVEGVEVGSWQFEVVKPQPFVPLATPQPTPPTPTVTPAAAPYTALGCSSGRSAVSFLPHPRRCTVLRSSRANREVHLSKLHWSGWGGSSAEATGRWKLCDAGSCASGVLEAKASRRISACDRFAYTRLIVHLFSAAGDRTYLLRLPPC